jgi:hypothetical protein
VRTHFGGTRRPILEGAICDIMHPRRVRMVSGLFWSCQAIPVPTSWRPRTNAQRLSCRLYGAAPMPIRSPGIRDHPWNFIPHTVCDSKALVSRGLDGCGLPGLPSVPDRSLKHGASVWLRVVVSDQKLAIRRPQMLDGANTPSVSVDSTSSQKRHRKTLLLDNDHGSFVDRHRRRSPNLRQDASRPTWVDQGRQGRSRGG